MCDNPPLPVATATCAIYSTVSRSIIHRFQSYQGLCAPENLTVSMMPLPHIQYGPIPLPGVNCPLPQPLTTATRGYPTVSQSIHHQFHSFEALCTPHVPTASMTQLPPNKNTPLSVFTTTATASCHCHCQFLLTSPRKAATAPSLHPHPLKIATSWPPQQCMQSEGARGGCSAGPRGGCTCRGGSVAVVAVDTVECGGHFGRCLAEIGPLLSEIRGW
jgi:hypothetical protein